MKDIDREQIEAQLIEYLPGYSHGQGCPAGWRCNLCDQFGFDGPQSIKHNQECIAPALMAVHGQGYALGKAATQAQIEAAAKAIHDFEFRRGYVTEEWSGADNDPVFRDMAKAALMAAAAEVGRTGQEASDYATSSLNWTAAAEAAPKSDSQTQDTILVTKEQIKAAMMAYDKEYFAWGENVDRRERAWKAALMAAAAEAAPKTMRTLWIDEFVPENVASDWPSDELVNNLVTSATEEDSRATQAAARNLGDPKKVEDDTYLLTISEWKDAVREGHFNEHDGSGCWVKDGYYMTNKLFDNVFGPTPEGATHVAWWNK